MFDYLVRAVQIEILNRRGEEFVLLKNIHTFFVINDINEFRAK